MKRINRFNEGIEKTNNDSEIEKYWDNNMPNETTLARLRNQLSPLYSLVDMVLLMEEKDSPELRQIIKDTAKQADISKERILFLIRKLESNGNKEI
jgi:hypothetical protein